MAVVETSKVSRWRALEANPEVLSSYLKELGGPSDAVDFVDVFDPVELKNRNTLALLFVYPITEKFEAKRRATQVEQEKDPLSRQAAEELWVTRQTVGNACGTVALLHVFANLDKEKYPVRGALKDFLEERKNDDPEVRAEKLHTAAGIETAHEKAAADGQSESKEIVIEHYVAIIPWKGKLVELDGRKIMPFVFDQKHPGDFLASAFENIRERYFQVDPAECRYSLVAVCDKV